MVLAYTNFGYVAPDGTQVNFPYTDRYQDWVIIIQYLQPAKRGTLSQWELARAEELIASQDRIVSDAARGLGAANPFEVFGTREPSIVDLSPEVAGNITGSQLVAIDIAIQQGIIETSFTRPVLITQDVIQRIENIIPVTVDTEIPTTPQTPSNPSDLNNIVNTFASNIPLLIIIAVGAYGLYEYFRRRGK